MLWLHTLHPHAVCSNFQMFLVIVHDYEKQPIKKFKWERLSQGSTSADLEEDGRSRQRTDGQSGSKEASFFI